MMAETCDECGGTRDENSSGPIVRGCAACCRDCGFPCDHPTDGEGFHVTAVTCPKDGTKVEEGTCCMACGVMAGEPCVECGESMYHRDGCNEIGAEIIRIGGDGGQAFGRRYRIVGGVEDEGWRKNVREGKVAWCEITVHEASNGGGFYLGAYGGEVWPGAWPSLFTPISPSVLGGSGGFSVTEAGLQALRCADKRPAGAVPAARPAALLVAMGPCPHGCPRTDVHTHLTAGGDPVTFSPAGR